MPERRPDSRRAAVSAARPAGVRARRPAIFSRDLGIDLRSGEERELFKWFLACLLFGKPIQQEVARRAYEELVAARLATPQAILEAGWDRLVAVLDRGHYVRFDFSTATRLLEVSRALLDRYGSLSALLEAARTQSDLGQRLQAFKGVGPTTARIFLRDILREVPAWRARARSRASGAHRRRPVRLSRRP
jgi:endonuclease III